MTPNKVHSAVPKKSGITHKKGQDGELLLKTHIIASKYGEPKCTKSEQNSEFIESPS